MRHKQPGSPKKPCEVTMTGAHQYVTFKKRTRSWVACWICGARPVIEE